MKLKALTATRYLFGLAFFVFGLNGFLHFMETPAPSPEAGALLGAFAATGYFFPMVKIVEVLTGVLLLANVYVPFALVFIAPILVGITSIHLFLDPAGMGMMIFLHGLHGFLVYGYWSYFKSVLTAKATPQ